MQYVGKTIIEGKDTCNRRQLLFLKQNIDSEIVCNVQNPKVWRLCHNKHAKRRILLFGLTLFF